LDQAIYPEASSGQLESKISTLRFQSASLFDLAPRGVCLAAHVATRAGALLLISNLISNLKLALAGRTVSPITGFESEISNPKSQNKPWLVCFLLHLSSPEHPNAAFQFGIWNLLRRPAVSGLAALWCSDFPLLLCISNFNLRFEILREAAITRLAPFCKAA